MDYPQERIGELAIGQEAEVVVDSFPRETFKGKVVVSLPQVNPLTRTLPVYIEVSNPGGRIRTGVSGFSRISVSAPQTIVVPSSAVIQDKTRAMVFCIEGGHARIRSVVPGHVVENGRWEVLEGLSPGDEVVIFGNKDLRDGDAVDTDWQTWSRRE
jgi:RND family efflux transporter MFP subunit